MDSPHREQNVFTKQKLSALAHTMHAHYAHVDKHIKYVRRNGPPRFVKRLASNLYIYIFIFNCRRISSQLSLFLVYNQRPLTGVSFYPFRHLVVYRYHQNIAT